MHWKIFLQRQNLNVYARCKCIFCNNKTSMFMCCIASYIALQGPSYAGWKSTLIHWGAWRGVECRIGKDQRRLEWRMEKDKSTTKHTHMRSLFCSDLSNNLIELKLGGFIRQTDIKSPDDIIPKQCSAVLCAVQLSTRKIDFMQGINCHEGGGQGGRLSTLDIHSWQPFLINW